MKKLEGKSDLELIQAYIANDELAIEVLLNRYKSKVYTSIYLQVKDEHLADDIFQETFIKVIRTLKAGRYNDQGKFLPWVIRIAQNMVIDHFRREKRAPSVVSSDGYDIFELLDIAEEDSESRMVRKQEYSDLAKIIQMLPDEQKEVLIMRHFCDMSFKDIAEITGVSINTALGRMRYALNNMRKLIEDNKMVFQLG